VGVDAAKPGAPVKARAGYSLDSGVTAIEDTDRDAAAV
jgi:hypothetical protein